MLLIGASAWWTAQRNVDASRSAKQTDEVLAQIDKLLVSLLNAETAVRGFIISGDSNGLERYSAEIASAGSTFSALRGLTQEIPKPQQLATLGQLLKSNASNLRQQVELRQGDDAAAGLSQAIAVGDRTMNAIRDVLGDMQTEEQQLLSAHYHAAQQTSRAINSVVVLGSLLAIALLGVANLIVSVEFRRRQQAEKRPVGRPHQIDRRCHHRQNARWHHHQLEITGERTKSSVTRRRRPSAIR